MSIAVLGGGAFGTALAISLAQNGPVVLWMRDASQALATRQAPRLPGFALPEAIHVTSDLAEISDCRCALLAIPTQQVARFLAGNTLPEMPIILCCKGVDIATCKGPLHLLNDGAVLSGPGFAADIARGLPTALTLGCADEPRLMALQQMLTTPNLRIYRTTDTIGVELGGALKNVIAIAAGIVMGAGLGESARAGIITRGFAEIQRFACARGAKSETLAGLSGFGDLVLTCTSEGSRNYRFGLSIGQDVPFDADLTVEGRTTAQALAGLMDDLPICSAVAALIDGRLDVAGAMHTLLQRPLKEE